MDFQRAKEISLFADIAVEDIEKMYECLCTREREYKRDAFVFHAGDPVRFVYVILTGSMHIISEDFWGNRSIIETMHRDTLFGEAYVFSLAQSHLVSVVAAEDSVVIEIDPTNLFEICPRGCECHAQMIRNALFLVSKKIVRLTEKMGHIIHRTIREKILSYLSRCVQCEKSNAFSIPYSRQQLADYLCVDRSALSHELSKLQDQGLIRYRKNYFELIGGHDEM